MKAIGLRGPRIAASPDVVARAPWHRGASTLLLAIAGLALAATPAPAKPDRPMDVEAYYADDPTALAVYAGLLAEIAQQGSVAIIVRLDATFAPEAQMPAARATHQRQTIAARQNGLVAELAGHHVTNVKRFATIPYMALRVDAPGLEAVLASRASTAVQLDVPVPPSLLDSVPLIGADVPVEAGFDG